MILRALNRRTAPYLSGADRQYGQLEVNEAIRARRCRRRWRRKRRHQALLAAKNTGSRRGGNGVAGTISAEGKTPAFENSTESSVNGRFCWPPVDHSCWPPAAIDTQSALIISKVVLSKLKP